MCKVNIYHSKNTGTSNKYVSYKVRAIYLFEPKMYYQNGCRRDVWMSITRPIVANWTISPVMVAFSRYFVVTNFLLKWRPLHTVDARRTFRYLADVKKFDYYLIYPC